AHVAVERAAQGEAGVEAAVADALVHPGGDAVLQGEVEPRMALEEGAYERPEPDADRIEDRADARLAGEMAFELLRHLAEVGRLRDHRLGVWKQCFAGLGEPNAAGAALEELELELLLERLDLSAHRRLADVEQRGGLREMPLLRDDHERAQQVELHVR